MRTRASGGKRYPSLSAHFATTTATSCSRVRRLATAGVVRHQGGVLLKARLALSSLSLLSELCQLGPDKNRRQGTIFHCVEVHNYAALTNAVMFLDESIAWSPKLAGFESQSLPSIRVLAPCIMVSKVCEPTTTLLYAPSVECEAATLGEAQTLFL